MKARIFTTAVLMIVALTTFAQTSRRGERNNDKNTTTEDNRNNDKKSESTKVSRREARKIEKQKETNQPADNNQQNRDRKDDNRNNNSQTHNDRPGNQNNNNNNNQGDNRRDDHSYRPVERDNNNNNRPGEGRRDVPDNRGNANYARNREHRDYIHINHTPRKVVVVNHPRSYRPAPIEYRRVNYPYRMPVHRDIVWSISFRNDFRIFYPEVRYWRYDIGYRIPLVSAYDAYDYIGDVARVYGKVADVYYDYDSDDYYLYIGDYYPYHDFSIIVSGADARSISRRPDRIFRKANIEVTGYITESDDKPEMIIRNARQIELY
jgi:hypothetical protein